MAYSAIDKSSAHMNTVLYTGNNSTNAVTGVGFQPDLCWIKVRDDTSSHRIFDAVRGVTKRLKPDQNEAEATESNGLTAFGTDGFTVGNSAAINGSGDLHAAWNWKANGQGSSNTDGTINTTYTSANQTSGFSICSWTGTGSAGTIGHGLNAVPKMIIVKRLDSADTWWVYHSALGSNDAYVALNEQNASSTSGGSGLWNSTAPTSSVFSVGTNTGVNGSGGTYVAYVYAEKAGYSKIDKWIGNGNANGTFAYCGFKPAFLLLKNTAITASWVLLDAVRDPGNSVATAAFPDASGQEYDYTTLLDFVSNGIKIRSTGSAWNGAGNTIAFIAFGQTLVGSNNVPSLGR